MDALLWNNWLVMALVTPALWAASCLLDVCFVGERIFRKPSDGPVISGLFCIVPLGLAVANIHEWPPVSFDDMWPPFVAGVCYFLHLYFVFRALFTMNDASCSETFNLLTVLFVPLLAFVLLDERLAPPHYLAVFLALSGVAILTRYYLAGERRDAIPWLLLAVLCVSLVMVIQAWALARVSYWYATGLFAAGTCMTAIMVGGLTRVSRRRLYAMCRQFWAVFLGAELLQTGAVLSSQRATDIGPSVSFVAVVECSLPAFIMLFSAVGVWAANRRLPLRPNIRDALCVQTDGLFIKLASLGLIGSAILMVPA